MPPKAQKRAPSPTEDVMVVMLYMFVNVTLYVGHPDRIIYVGKTKEFARRMAEHFRRCHNKYLKELIDGEAEALKNLEAVVKEDSRKCRSKREHTRTIKMIAIPHVPFLEEKDNPGRWEYFFMKKFNTVRMMRKTGCNIYPTGYIDDDTEEFMAMETQYQQWLAAAATVPTPKEEAGPSDARPPDAVSTALTIQTLADGFGLEDMEKNMVCLMTKMELEQSFGLTEDAAETQTALNEQLVVFERAETMRQKKAEEVYDYAFAKRDWYRAMLADTLVDRDKVMSEINHIKDQTKDGVVKKQISVASAALHPDIPANMVTADLCVHVMGLVATTLCNRKEKEMLDALEVREAQLAALEERWSAVNPEMSTEECNVLGAGLTLRERMIRKVVDMRDANARDTGGKPFGKGTTGDRFWLSWKIRKVAPGSLGTNHVVQTTERIEEDTVRFLWRNHPWFAKVYLVSGADRNDDLFPWLKDNLEEGVALAKEVTPSATRSFSRAKEADSRKQIAYTRLRNFVVYSKPYKDLSDFLAGLRHLPVVEELWEARLRNIGPEVGCATVDALVHWSRTAKTSGEVRTRTEAQIEADEKKRLAKHEEATRNLPEAEKKVADAKFRKKKGKRAYNRKLVRGEAAAADANDAADAAADADDDAAPVAPPKPKKQRKAPKPKQQNTTDVPLQALSDSDFE